MAVGVPNDKTIPVMTAVLESVTAILVANNPEAAAVASVFVCICAEFPQSIRAFQS